MKRITKLMIIILGTGILALSLTSLASAKEIIELRKAGGGGYSYYIMAYDRLQDSYYHLTGTISSDAHKILVPKGYGSMITVTGPGHTSGLRNFFQTGDSMNPKIGRAHL